MHRHFTNILLNLDLLNIVMIGLAKELPEYDEQYEIHRLLGALLSSKLTTDEKLNIIEREYDIPVGEDLRKDVSVMCNLSQGVREEGRAEGEAKIILKMYQKGNAIEQIAINTDKSIDEIREILAKYGSVQV